MLLTLSVLKGEPITIPSIEVIKNLNPNEENMIFPNIDMFSNPNPNLLFHSRIQVLRSPIPFS